MKRKKTRSPKSNETNEKTNKKRKIDTTDPPTTSKEEKPPVPSLRRNLQKNESGTRYCSPNST